jgi:hypothetical protein
VKPILALVLGRDHRRSDDGVRPDRRKACGFIRQGARCDPDGLGEVGDDRGIDRIRFRPLTEGLGEAANLDWIDDDNCEAGGGEAGRDHGLETTGRFEGDEAGRKRSAPSTSSSRPGRCARDGEGFSARTRGDVQAILGDIDTDDDLIRADPSLPHRARSAAPATFQVRWTQGRSDTASHRNPRYASRGNQTYKRRGGTDIGFSPIERLPCARD